MRGMQNEKCESQLSSPDFFYVRPADKFGRYKLAEIEIGDRARWRVTGKEGRLFMEGPYLCLQMLDESKPAVVIIFPQPGRDQFVPSLVDVRRLRNVCPKEAQ